MQVLKSLKWGIRYCLFGVIKGMILRTLCHRIIVGGVPSGTLVKYYAFQMWMDQLSIPAAVNGAGFPALSSSSPLLAFPISWHSLQVSSPAFLSVVL